MAAPKLGPVPPLTSLGFADPVWAKWLGQLRQQVVSAVTTANLTFTNGNGFTGTFTPVGSNITLTIGTSVVGLMKGNGTAASAATPGVDYTNNVQVTAPITNTGTAAAPNIGHATSGVTAGTYTKVTVNGFGHVTAGSALASSDVTTALGFTPLNPANNLSDVANVATARTNLGLGTAAVQNATFFLQTANNLSDVPSPSTARTNLGLGTAAVQNVSFFLQAANNLSDLTNAGTARTNLGLGTMAVQNATAVAITGGTIDGTSIGLTTPSNARFTTVGSTQNAALRYNNTSGQSIPNNANTTVTNWTSQFDRNTSMVGSTGVFTAQVAGVYSVDAQLTFSTAAGVSAAVYQAIVAVNGTAVQQGRFDQTSTASVAVTVTVNCLLNLALNDTVVIQAFQSTGVARTLSTSAALTWVDICRIP